MLKIAICDDQQNFLKNLNKDIENILIQNNLDYKTFEYNSGTLLINDYKNEIFDIIFLDIHMPKINGFEIAEIIRSLNTNTFIIFVTSKSELVFDSFNYQPFDFIQKISKKPLIHQLQRTFKNLLRHIAQNKVINLKDAKQREHAVALKDIIYIESNAHFVNYYIKDLLNPITIRKNLSDIENELNKFDFVRTHKKYLLNLKYFDMLDADNTIKIKFSTNSIPLSRNYKKDVLEKYKLYMRTKL